MSTSVWLSNLYTDTWPNTEEPAPQDRIQLFICTYKRKFTFSDSNVHILDREDRWFERGVKEAIHVYLEQPSLNRSGASDTTSQPHIMQPWNFSSQSSTSTRTFPQWSQTTDQEQSFYLLVRQLNYNPNQNFPNTIFLIELKKPLHESWRIFKITSPVALIQPAPIGPFADKSTSIAQTSPLNQTWTFKWGFFSAVLEFLLSQLSHLIHCHIRLPVAHTLLPHSDSCPRHPSVALRLQLDTYCTHLQSVNISFFFPCLWTWAPWIIVDPMGFFFCMCAHAH